MHIIFVSDRMATARTVTITPRVMMLAGLALVGIVVGLSSLFSFITIRHAAEIRLPLFQEMALNLRKEEEQKTQDFMRENLNAMAIRLGEMQAQMMRLDSLGERVGRLVGIKPQELRLNEKPGQGGVQTGPTSPISAEELQQQVEALAHQLENRGDYLGLVEAELIDDRIRRNLLPTTMPIGGGLMTSSFGWRIDPFTGHRALHEGVDFPSSIGSPIKAAAGGVIIAAASHPQYGNMVEVDHGNGLVTRYAHASRLTVKEGAVVKRGQKLAEVGSTGRSTGPHLHFEVRKDGVAVNPHRFLRNAQRGLLASR
ncbi:MAG: M23 family metallopeptidase [Betaproteobacteria bacterium]|nr:M23 family metallopeptidase [Betaproteobacteria bacterium]